MHISRVATLSAALGLLAGAAFGLGPAGIQIGIFTPFIGFRIFGLGALVGLLALVLGLIGLWRTRHSAQRDGRSRAVAGTALGGLVVLTILLVVGSAGNLPAINDITTDLDDAPSFSFAQKIEANEGRDLSYAGGELAGQQRQGYPDLATIEVDGSPSEVLVTAETIAQQLGWEITYRDASRGTFEATQTTPIFRFVDDIVVRVRPSGSGSRIDVRSKSRDGKGDIGANAARIRAFRDALTR
jgi:uncharacterized protein (DUF1499 family)